MSEIKKYSIAELIEFLANVHFTLDSMNLMRLFEHEKGDDMFEQIKHHLEEYEKTKGFTKRYIMSQPVVTREDISRLVFEIQTCSTPGVWATDIALEFFTSKGIKVEEESHE